MDTWLRKGLGWFVLAATLLSVPGPMSSACACTRAMAGEAQLKKECPRCMPPAGYATSGVKIQLSRSACCRSKVSDAGSAAAPSTVQLERPVTRGAAPAAIATAPSKRASSPRGGRAPPRRGTRDAASPPASYLSDYLRL